MFHRMKCVPMAAVLAALGCGSICRADLTVRFDPPETIVGLDSIFTMDIVADMPDPVLAWGLDLTIDDPSIVSLAGAPTVGPAWLPTFTPDGDGLGGLAFPTGVSGPDVLLATVTFSADALGETDLLLSVTAGDPTEGFGLDPFGFADVTFEIGHVAVVPAPHAVLLGVIGLGIVLGTRRWCP